MEVSGRGIRVKQKMMVFYLVPCSYFFYFFSLTDKFYSHCIWEKWRKDKNKDIVELYLTSPTLINKKYITQYKIGATKESSLSIPFLVNISTTSFADQTMVLTESMVLNSVQLKSKFIKADLSRLDFHWCGWVDGSLTNDRVM